MVNGAVPASQSPVGKKARVGVGASWIALAWKEANLARPSTMPTGIVGSRSGGARVWADAFDTPNVLVEMEDVFRIVVLFDL
jgi:hypothetical protein